MKFKIHQKDLISVLLSMETVLSSKAVIESLKGIKIDVKENSISFTASKSKMSIINTVTTGDSDIENLEKGSCVIAGFQFINIIKKINENYITIEKIDSKIHIKTIKTHIEMNEYDIHSYPQILFDIKSDETITLDKNIFYDTYQKTKYSISTNPMKQILTGVNFKILNNELKMASTDSLRMTFYKKEFQTSSNLNITIDKEILQSLIKILDQIDDNDVDIQLIQNQFLLSSKNIKIKAKLLDGQFPEIEKIIPDETNFSFETKKDELMPILDRVLLLNDRSESVLTLEYVEEHIKLYSNHKFLGGIEEICEIQNLSGTPFKLSFDPKFVFDAMHTIDGNTLVFGFVDEVSGFTISDKDSDDIINVISPIRMM